MSPARYCRHRDYGKRQRPEEELQTITDATSMSEQDKQPGGGARDQRPHDDRPDSALIDIAAADVVERVEGQEGEREVVARVIAPAYPGQVAEREEQRGSKEQRTADGKHPGDEGRSTHGV